MLAEVLSDYDQAHPAYPTLVDGKPKRDINVFIPIDPSSGYSLRSARSDGWMTVKTQVALRGTRSGALVNCYLPVARVLFIGAETSLPLLLSADEGPDQAELRRWLALSQEVSRPEAEWSGLAYQTLLTQGQQQSLSLASGVLEIGWLVSLQERLGTGVIAFWRALLSAKGIRDRQEPLLDCLKCRSADSWITHLSTLAHSTQIPNR